MIFVYQIKNKINDKRYIGITNDFDKRMKDHKKSYGSKLLFRAFNKYSDNSFECKIIHSVDTWSFGCELEKFYIGYYNTRSPNGYNLTNGGDGVVGVEPWNKGCIVPEEQKQKISNKLKEFYANHDNPFKDKSHSSISRDKISKSCKKAMTGERRKQISEFSKSRKGYNHTEETREKIRQSNLGKVCLEKTKKKISESKIGKCFGVNNSFYGKHHTEEAKNIIAEIHKGNTYNKGRVFSEEHKRKLADAKRGKVGNNTGHKHSEEAREKIRQSNLSRKVSKETREKMSLTHKNIRRIQYDSVQ